MFETVDKAIAQFTRGGMLGVVDDEDRENEGDLCVAAEHTTPEAVTFMARQCCGLICVALDSERVDALGLRPMVPPAENGTAHGTAFTVSVEAARGVTTGISACDRSHTIRLLASPTATATDFTRPGHVFPLHARPGGVLARPGHTEAGVDLARLAGLQPAATICEIMAEDGTMMRLPALQEFARRHGLPILSIAELIAYRRVGAEAPARDAAPLADPTPERPRDHDPTLDEHRFPDEQRRGVYRAIHERRDVRSQFKPTPIPNEVLARLLDAAHHAPSVGFMQPWRFILIREAATREAVQGLFERANADAVGIYLGERRELYSALKLAGIRDAPINLCIVCDPRTSRGHGLGRQSMPETVAYSTVCAVQNLWLAARAEGVGVGWVSILDPAALREVLGIPPEVTPVAYLCLGYVTEFLAKPELELRQWERRAPLDGLLHFDGFGKVHEDHARELLASLRRPP